MKSDKKRMYVLCSVRKTSPRTDFKHKKRNLSNRDKSEGRGGGFLSPGVISVRSPGVILMVYYWYDAVVQNSTPVRGSQQRTLNQPLVCGRGDNNFHPPMIVRLCNE